MQQGSTCLIGSALQGEELAHLVMGRSAQYRAPGNSTCPTQESGEYSADMDPKPLRQKPPLWHRPMGARSLGDQVLTVTLHPLVDETIQQRSTVVTEGRAGVGVDLKLVLAPGVLRPRQTDRQKRPLLVRRAEDQARIDCH